MARIKYTYRTGDSPTHNSTGQRPQSVAPVGDESPDPDEHEPGNVDRWWRESSFDLMHGLDVHEIPMGALPRDWVDELFKH
jgi:hypothetical protein